MLSLSVLGNFRAPSSGAISTAGTTTATITSSSSGRGKENNSDDEDDDNGRFASLQDDNNNSRTSSNHNNNNNSNPEVEEEEESSTQHRVSRTPCGRKHRHRPHHSNNQEQQQQNVVEGQRDASISQRQQQQREKQHQKHLKHQLLQQYYSCLQKQRQQQKEKRARRRQQGKGSGTDGDASDLGEGGKGSGGLSRNSSFRVGVLPQMKSPSDARSEAVTFLGLLRHEEDRLVERSKELVRRDRAFIQDVFTCLVDEWTPLHACTLRGARKLVKVALKAGVDPDLEMGVPEGLPGHCSPLHLAAYRGDVSILQLLVQHGASLDKPDDLNRTPLFYAVRRRNTLAAKKLIKYGADLSGLTPDERDFFWDEISKRGHGPAVLCIPVPVRSGSQKHRHSHHTPQQQQQQDSHHHHNSTTTSTTTTSGSGGSSYHQQHRSSSSSGGGSSAKYKVAS